jgi:UDPglucose 6-dehydrogenase
LNLLVVGLGKLGLPLAAVLAEAGHKVFGIDKSEELVKRLIDQNFSSSEPKLLELLRKNSDDLTFSNDLSKFMEIIDVVFVIVPTPSNDDGSFSNSLLIEAVAEVGQSVKGKKTQTVINIVSTVMPGSCDGVLKKNLEINSEKELGENLALCYNPEFIALGSVVNDMQYPDMHLLGASHDWAANTLENILTSMVLTKVPCLRMSLLEAELVKISINNYVTMKISYANSLMQVANSLGKIDIDTVTKAIGLDSRIGSKYMKAASPYGGPCFPRDTRAMTYLFDKASIKWSLSNTTENLNKNHIEFITHKILDKISNNTKVGILGISYKPGTPVIEESSGVFISQELISRGVSILTWDDENASVPGHSKSIRNLDEILEEADFFVITRTIEKFDYVISKLEENGKEYLDLWRQKNK